MLWDMMQYKQKIWNNKESCYKNENTRLRIESESLLKVIELLSVQQINVHEINDNT